MKYHSCIIFCLLFLFIPFFMGPVASATDHQYSVIVQQNGQQPEDCAGIKHWFGHRARDPGCFTVIQRKTTDVMDGKKKEAVDAKTSAPAIINAKEISLPSYYRFISSSVQVGEKSQARLHAGWIQTTYVLLL